MKNDMTCIFTAILDTDKNFPGIFFTVTYRFLLRMLVKIDSQISLKKVPMMPIVR